MASPITIPLAAGLQTELADYLVQPGATLVSENIVCDQTGKARVRFGADVLSTASQATLPAAGTLPLPWQLATLGGSLVRFNRAPEPLHVWAPSPQAWVRHAQSEGGLISYRRGPIKIDTSPVFSGATASESLSRPTVAVSADAIVCVYQAASAAASNTIVTLMDRTSRKALYTRQTPTGTITPRVVIVGTRAVVAYESGGSLQVDSYNLTTYTLSQQQTMGAVLSGTAIDMRAGSPVAGANNVGILYRTSGSGELRLATVDATNLASNSTDTPRTTAAGVVVPDLGFKWMQDFGASGKFSILIADTTNGLRTLWDLPAPAGGFTNATATHVLDAAATAAPSGATAGIRNIIGTTTSSLGTGLYRVLYEVTAPNSPTRAELRSAIWTGAAQLGTAFRSVGLRSTFWAHSTNFYFLAGFPGTDQQSYFVLGTGNDLNLLSTYPAPLAVALPRDARGLTAVTNAVSDVSVAPDGAVYIGAESIVRTEESENAGTATGDDITVYAIETIRVRHSASVETENGRPIEYLRSLFVPGGLLGTFDGSTYGAAGFAYYPPPVVATAQAGGNLTATATYQYRVLYSFIDRNGRKWRSSPSAPVTATLSGGDQKFSLAIETLRLVDRGILLAGQNIVGGVQIEAFRTQANATEGYFQVAAMANDPNNHTVTLVDNVADTNLGEQLYTDGNGVENELLPPIAWCVEHQGRLVCGEAGTGTVWYSTEADFTSGPIFGEALTFDVGDPSEPTTGAAVFNEQLFVFKAGKTYLVSGQGANALGQGATYEYRLLDGGIGCDNPQSIVVADDGVWFRSSSDRAGMHRTNGGAPEYVGQGVRGYDSFVISSAVVVREKTEIRWYTELATTLVWNWTTRAWSTNTSQPCLSAVSSYDPVAGVVYAHTDGRVLSEATVTSADPWVEAGANYFGRIRTPWYGRIGGWERIRRLQGVGDGFSNHRTVIGLYKNMEFTPFQTATIVFDSTRPRWDWELRPEQQKFSNLMIEIIIGAYQPPNVSITPGADTFDGFDVDLGTWLWTFENGSFTAGNVGDTIVVVGGTKAGSYTITHVLSPTEVGMTPNPGGGTGAISATSITLTPALVYTAGPGMVGVALLPAVKEGMDKLPAARRAT